MSGEAVPGGVHTSGELGVITCGVVDEGWHGHASVVRQGGSEALTVLTADAHTSVEGRSQAPPLLAYRECDLGGAEIHLAGAEECTAQ